MRPEPSRAASDDRWWRGLDELILAAMPRGGRVLDVGCGAGGLVDRLVAGGLDAYGVDPRAPTGSRLIRSRLEEWSPVGRFDGACAAMSLHHAPLSAVLDVLARSLDPHGRLFVYEFAWEEYDDRAGSWLSAHGRGHADNSVAAWQAEHSELHTGVTVRAALADAFDLRLETPCPYLARMLGRHELEDDEQALISAGELPAIGRRYIADTHAPADA